MWKFFFWYLLCCRWNCAVVYCFILYLYVWPFKYFSYAFVLVFWLDNVSFSICWFAVNQTWSQPEIKGSPPTPRDSHTCSVIDEKLYVFGGTDGMNPLKDLHILDTCELSFSYFYSIWVCWLNVYIYITIWKMLASNTLFDALFIMANFVWNLLKTWDHSLFSGPRIIWNLSKNEECVNRESVLVVFLPILSPKANICCF